MAVYAVTGAAGFIGSNLVERLIKDGHAVRGIDNLATGRMENINNLLDSFEFIKGDINDSRTLQKLFKGADFVLHQAAVPSVPKSVAEPMLSHTANATGTLNVLINARDAGVERVVYAASSSAYGDSPRLPKVETMPENPLSPYAVNKLAGEHYMTVFNNVYGLETISLRYFNIFGPRQNPKSQYAAVVPAFITRMLADKQPTIYGDGKQSRDFTYIDNAVEANLAAATADSHATGKVYNIACGAQMDLLQLVDIINQTLNKNIKPQFEDERPGDVKHSKADIGMAAQLLGFKPSTDSKAGIQKTIEHLRNR